MNLLIVFVLLFGAANAVDSGIECDCYDDCLNHLLQYSAEECADKCGLPFNDTGRCLPIWVVEKAVTDPCRPECNREPDGCYCPI